MTMFSLPNFCRVCLKYDKNLIDLEHIENEPSETLMSKLQQCVSEVEWSVFKPLLCHPCIKRLNIAYTFKKQCVQSATVLKSYVALVRETKSKNESPGAKINDLSAQNNAYMMLPNQKYIKIVVGPQTQNTFQNVFLNVVPTSAITPVIAPVPIESKNNKDTNQNVFVSINNTLQKFVPIAPAESNQVQAEKNVNVNQLLTEAKTEELSVEIDPTDFGLEENGDSDEEFDEEANDWDELISPSQILSSEVKNTSMLKENAQKSEIVKSNMYGNFVPILPKQPVEDKNDFFNSGQHFLSSTPFISREALCETCQKTFTNLRLLKHHIREFHMGKLPFKCSFCYAEYALRADYQACVKSHKTEPDTFSCSLTLKDFRINNEQNIINTDNHATNNITTNSGHFACDLCRRQFTSTAGLLRHKVRKHNQKNKKKYFIKGMKNAKCDICNREFSTQSYMQLHRKLHLRDDIGYKYKVFGKSKYPNKSNNGKNDDMKGEKSSHDYSDTENEIVSKLQRNSNKSIDDNQDGSEDNYIHNDIKMEIEENDLVIDENCLDDADESEDN